MALRFRFLHLLMVTLPIFTVVRCLPSDDQDIDEAPEGATVSWNFSESSASASASSGSIHVGIDRGTTIPGPSMPSNTTQPTNGAGPKKVGDRRMSAYFPSYNADARPVSEIRYDLYDELVFFVATTQANFTIGLGGLNQTYWDSLAYEFVSRCKNESVIPSYSLGGFTGSIYFSSLVATAENRTAYAKSCVDFAKKYGFCGIDVDWEYPCLQGIGCNVVNDTDVTNFQLFMKEIKDIWPEGKLSSAVSIAGIRDSDFNPVPAANLTLLVEVIDCLKIMCYDVYGAWSFTTGPLAPLNATCADSGSAQSVETAIEVYLDQGFSPSQLSIGIPGYGRSFNLTSPTLSPKVVGGFTTYYYQNFTGVPPGGQFDDKPGKDVCGQNTTWGGTWLVSELVSNGFLSEDETTGGSGYTRYLDECSGEPFIASNTTMISYDDTESTLRKVEYIKSKNITGIFFFDTNGPLDATISAARQALLS